MVSERVYIQTFLKVVPERMREIAALRKKKYDLDRFVLSGKGGESEYHALIKIIGEDHFFRKAEKTKGNTLRRICWKMSKSSKLMFNATRKWNHERGAKEQVDRKRAVDPYVSPYTQLEQSLHSVSDFLLSTLENLHHAYDNMDAIFEKEVNCLKLMIEQKQFSRESVTKYNLLVEQETKLDAAVSGYFRKFDEEFKKLVGELRKMTKENLSYFAATWVFPVIAFVVGNLLFTVFTATPMFSSLVGLGIGGMAAAQTLLLTMFNAGSEFRESLGSYMNFKGFMKEALSP